MQTCIAFLVILATSSRIVGADRSGPLLKVAQLLEDLEAKIRADGQQALKQFEEYTQWCKMNAKDLKYEVKVATSEIEELNANTQKAASDMSAFSTRIEELAATLSENEGEVKQAALIRGKEHKQFSATEQELLDTIDTLERATNWLQRRMQAGGALLQAKVDRRDVKALINTLQDVVNAASLTLRNQKVLVALAQNDEDTRDDLADMSAPAAAVYENKGSTPVLDMIEDLKQRAEKQLGALRKEEANARQSYELLKQSLQDQIKIDNQEMKEAKEAKFTASGRKAAAEGDLSATKTELANDEERLAKLTNDCFEAAGEHDRETHVREEEAATISKAATILRDIAGPASASSFLQLKSSSDGFEVVNLLRDLARKQSSTNLAQMAGRISTVMTRAAKGHGMPGHRMIQEMIENMISHLEAEGKAETNHKEYCERANKETRTKKGDLTYDTEKLSAQIDKTQAKVQSLRDQVQTLQEELSTIAKSSAEADRMRTEASEIYEAKTASIRNEMSAVRAALKVLKERFPAAKEAPTLLQQHLKSLKHATAEIISLMEEIEGEMSQSLALTEEDERLDQGAYKKLKQVNEIATVQKQKDVEHKEKVAAALQKSIADHRSDLDGVQTELDAVSEYWKNIVAMCAEGPDTYDSRRSRRQAEIDGLQEALQVLNGQAVLLQPVFRRLRRSAGVLH